MQHRSALRIGMAMCAVLLSTACASGGSAPPGKVVPAESVGVTSNDLKLYVQEERMGRGRSIYAENHSKYTVRITKLTITSCNNVTGCGPNDLNIDIAPGGTELILKVDAANVQAQFSFDYTYEFAVVLPAS